MYFAIFCWHLLIIAYCTMVNEILICYLWKKHIELVPYHATKISRKTQKHLLFPLIAKLVCFSCVFCVRLREMSQKIKRKGVIRTQDLSILNDLQKKRKFRRILTLLTNKKESVVLGSFTFESSTTNLRHMLGLYVNLRNTRKKLLFFPGHKERVLSVSFTFVVNSPVVNYLINSMWMLQSCRSRLCRVSTVFRSWLKDQGSKQLPNEV